MTNTLSKGLDLLHLLAMITPFVLALVAWLLRKLKVDADKRGSIDRLMKLAALYVGAADKFVRQLKNPLYRDSNWTDENAKEVAEQVVQKLLATAPEDFALAVQLLSGKTTARQLAHDLVEANVTALKKIPPPTPIIAATPATEVGSDLSQPTP